MDLWSIPAIDQHAHNVWRPETMAGEPFFMPFTEGCDSCVRKEHAATMFSSRRALRDIGGLLECDPSEDAIQDQRRRIGWEELTRKCLSAANLDMIFLDDGFGAGNSLPWRWHKQFVTSRRLERLEFLAESLIEDSRNWAEFLAMYRAECENLDYETIGLKSIAAYRCGLDLWPLSLEDARLYYEELKKRPAPYRITGRALIGLLVDQAMQATERRRLPIQFHTGFGDPDLDLLKANPLRLRPLLEDSRYSHRPIVLLHAGYPYCREAAYLAAVYPQVYVDTGLALPHLSRQGMIQIWRTLFEYCPTSKILYSSDAHMIPELFYLGSRYTRETLAQVLEASVEDGDLTAREAEQIGMDILAGNADRLYNNRVDG